MRSKKQNLSPIRMHEKSDSTIRRNQKIDYKDIDLLTRFVTNQGKIRPRRLNGVTLQQQRKLTKAIKRARILSLFPFVASNSA